MGEKLTKRDVEKIEQEIEHRKLVVRKEAIEAVKEARAQGDLSENFEYYAAKRHKNQNESRIRYLERMLKTADIVTDLSREDEVGMDDIVEVEFEEDGEIEMEKEFADAVRATDIWSVDKYMALHWGWPFDVADEGGNSFSRSKVADTYNLTKLSEKRYRELCGGEKKPMVMSEFNADGDVTGPYEQAEMVKEFCDMLKNDKDQGWFNGFTFYQFRDRGRLGLEIEDPNNADCGIEQPVMQTYKEIIHDEYFYPEMKSEGDAQFPAKLRWGGSEDAEGIEIPLHFEKNPTFCEITFEDEDADLNLMMEINGKWFYKAPHAKTIDFMSAFFEKPLDGEADMTLKIFAPPASGENVNDGSEDWMLNTYSTITKMPNIRIRFAPILK